MSENLTHDTSDVRLLSMYFHFSDTLQNGLTALHLAAKENHPDVVRELIGRSALVDASTKKRNTPLHIASLAGNYEIASQLIDAGAQVNAQSQVNWTEVYFNQSRWPGNTGSRCLTNAQSGLLFNWAETLTAE